MQASSVEWFYSQLKGKFRRFGSAKVYRALKKRNKYGETESESELEPVSPNQHSTNALHNRSLDYGKVSV